MNRTASHTATGQTPQGQAALTPAHAILTDRVNVEPPIINGMTASEAKVIGLVALAVWGSLGALVALALGFWQVLLVMVMLFPMVTLWIASKRLAQIKRGRPDGYYGQAMHLWAVRRGLVRPRFNTRSGYWELGISSSYESAARFDIDRTTSEKARK